ncbi:DUF1800 domain-containing protein [Fodinicola acaciae]|uniref:DUF1800 domain-containing protein n=1 Tax=Fodinicola acaciae TaxID=2681555 RepID=UPI0013D861DC|nr:DUF1800 family protein [Fodinicola acaciae]
MAVITERAAVVRLLQRTGFTAHTADVDAAVAAGFDATLARTLAAVPEPVTSPAFAPVTRPDKNDKDAKKAYQQQVRAQSQQLVLWWLDHMVTTVQPWIEKRTLLWHGHWATSIKKVKWPAAMALQNQTERTLGGGDFRTFARAMVRDPALMLWLDAAGNTAKAPNENLARELMELFTLGVGHYSEDDVRQAARALTGWLVDRRDDKPSATFVARRHAEGTQTILGQTADFTDQSLVDLLVSRPYSARYLATRMWGWLVSPTPPSESSLARITAAYGPGRDLTAMFRAILADPAFRQADSVVVKQPIEYVVGALRDLGLRPSTMDKKLRLAVARGLTGLGQTPFDPPSVGGWPTGGAWLTTAAAQTRIKLAAALARAADLKAVSSQSVSKRPAYVAGMLGVSAWTARTQSVLTSAASNPAELVTLALAAPEYVVSR